MNTFEFKAEAIKLAMLSTIIELCLALPAFAINLNAALIGLLLGVGFVISLIAAARWLPNHYFLNKAPAGSSSEAFWSGTIWKSYCITCSNRSISVKALFLDNWAICALLIFALFDINVFYTCAALGVSAGISAISLVQYFLKPKA